MKLTLIQRMKLTTQELHMRLKKGKTDYSTKIITYTLDILRKASMMGLGKCISMIVGFMKVNGLAERGMDQENSNFKMVMCMSVNSIKIR